MEQKTKNKIEFSKIVAGIIIIILVIFSIWACVEYYVLARLAIASTTEYTCPTLPDASLAIACITSILGVFASYCLYQFGLKNSMNKNGLEYDGLTGSVRRIPQNPCVNEVAEVEIIQTKEKTKKDSKDKNKKILQG